MRKKTFKHPCRDTNGISWPPFWAANLSNDSFTLPEYWICSVEWVLHWVKTYFSWTSTVYRKTASWTVDSSWGQIILNVFLAWQIEWPERCSPVANTPDCLGGQYEAHYPCRISKSCNLNHHPSINPSIHSLKKLNISQLDWDDHIGNGIAHSSTKDRRDPFLIGKLGLSLWLPGGPGLQGYTRWKGSAGLELSASDPGTIQQPGAQDGPSEFGLHIHDRTTNEPFMHNIS